MGSIRMPDPVRKKNADGSIKSDVWWLRKKVPGRYRDLVGSGEVWRSLDTTDRKIAVGRCTKLSLDLENDWEDRLRAAQAAGRGALPAQAALPQSLRLSIKELSGLQRLVHERTLEARIDDPPSPLRSLFAATPRTEDQDLDEREYDEQAMDEFLSRNGYSLPEADRNRFMPMFLEARREVHLDLYRAAKFGDFEPSPTLKKYAPSPVKRIDFPAAFEFYCDKAGIKGGSTGPTAKQWRPKIKAFCDFLKHSELGRVTTDDGYRWVDHLIAQGVSKKSVRDVWIASLKAVASFMVERRKIDANPFAGIRVRGAAKATNESNKKGFSDAQAEKILTATCATPSHLTIPETRAARRWVPWVCAYSGARVNEITSLLPSDVRPDPETGIWCFYLRPEMTKGDYMRVVPVHSHLVDQDFLGYVEGRRELGLPLFYDPKRARGGGDANPQWQKIAQRLGEWVVESLHVTGIKPNHGWRHRFKSVARHVGMHPEVEKFITGHGGSDDPDKISKVSMGYGDPWVKTLQKVIEMYPRYEIAALDEKPATHRRVRRTRAQIEADRAGAHRLTKTAPAAHAKGA
jgi:site-specific recombinase XerD